MKASLILLIVVTFLAVCSADRLSKLKKQYLAQGYEKDISYFRDKEVLRKGSDYVLFHEKIQRHRTLLDVKNQIEKNHAAHDWSKISPSVHKRRTEGPAIGILPDDYYRFIPTYMGSAIPGQPIISWSSTCYGSFTSGSELVTDSNGDFLGVRVWIQAADKQSWDCDDGYFIASIDSFQIHYFVLDGNTTFSFFGDYTAAQQYDFVNNGIRIFEFADDVTMSVVDVWETLQLFLGSILGETVPTWTAEDNIKFLADYANWTVEYRATDLVDFPEDQIQSGWFLGIIRMDGLDPMLAWGMGAHTGHTAITLRINGSLYVCESTVQSNYWPSATGIQKTPWAQWLQQAQDADYNVVLLPLSPQYQQLFNEANAYAWYNTVEGLPYGFHNMLFTWIDTPNDNYPPPLSSELVMLLFIFMDWGVSELMDTPETMNMIGQAMNHRMNTSGLYITDVYALAASKGISFSDLVTMPEQDSWVYSNDGGFKDGPSMVCDVFVCEMYKAAGLFGSITNQIECTEFTNWDVYTLNIYDGNFQRPQQCIDADPDLPYCQLMGEFRMTLPGYNTYAPFPHMREHCPSLPPDYIRPANC